LLTNRVDPDFAYAQSGLPASYENDGPADDGE
jgi:hypothetical protein